MSRLSKSIADKIVENSLEIYYQEVEDLKQKGNKLVGLCPIHNEKTGSFYVNTEFPYGSHCFGCGFSSNVIGMLKEKHNLSYQEAINYVENLKIDLNKPVEHKKIKESKPLVVDWIEQKFTDKHKQYFDDYELDESFLNSMDIYALKTLAINKRIVKNPSDWYSFVYFAVDINQIKVFNLGKSVTKADKWKSYNIPLDYLWYYYRFKDTKCDNLMIVKSNKDASVLSKLGYCCLVTQNESASTLIKNKDKIEAICDKPIIIYGSDDQGKQASIDANKVLNWRYFNTKNKYLKMYSVNDVAGLTKTYNLKKLKEELKNKGL